MVLILDCSDLYTAFRRTHPDTPDISPRFSCEVIFSSRKTLGLRIAKDLRITLRAPYHTPRAVLEDFLSSHRSWVFSHYLLQLARVEAADEREKKFPHTGDILRFYDRQFLLQIHFVPGRDRAFVCLDGQTLILDTPDLSPEYLHTCIALWYRKNGKRIFEERAAYYASQMHVTYQRITLKDQKTRWGSCSSLGNLNFNWKLLLMEPSILDYVVVHELAHRIEMNHSPAFWQIVAAVLPDYQERRRALKQVTSFPAAP